MKRYNSKPSRIRRVHVHRAFSLCGVATRWRRSIRTREKIQQPLTHFGAFDIPAEDDRPKLTSIVYRSPFRLPRDPIEFDSEAEHKEIAVGWPKSAESQTFMR